eukprot:SAG31_NODE_6825_length_1877_cov_1.097863_2_plen_90_part_00
MPANQCGPTNGDNEVWNLAKEPSHYEAIKAVMMLREDLRDYVYRINNESVHTGMPMMRAMALQFPADVTCGVGLPTLQYIPTHRVSSCL